MQYQLKKYLFLTIPVIFVSCFNYPEKKYENSDLAFTVPKGWAISSDKDEDGSDHILVCKKKGLLNNALITISWVNDSASLDESIERYKTTLKENFILKHSEQSFEATHEGYFNKYKCLLSNYSLTLLRVANNGAIYSFYGNKKTILILMQGPSGDTLKDNPDFKKIKETFVCK